jgi:hypothetical protein
MKKFGLRDIVAIILNDAGFKLTANDIRVAKGYWTHKTQDVYCWECYDFQNNVAYGCWQTLTEFVKNSKNGTLEIDEKSGEIWMEKK